MKIKNIRKDDEFGVSPVIAVILMVAITVVLAGVLYAMLNVPPPTTPHISVSASVTDKNTHWEIKIIGVSGGTLAVQDAKFQIVSKSNVVKLKTDIKNANPASITSDYTTAYPIPYNPSTPVQENATHGDGDIIDESSLDNPSIWENCALAYYDAMSDDRLSAGDSILVFKDWNGDRTEEIVPGYDFNLLDENNEPVLTKNL